MTDEEKKLEEEANRILAEDAAKTGKTLGRYARPLGILTPRKQQTISRTEKTGFSDSQLDFLHVREPGVRRSKRGKTVDEKRLTKGTSIVNKWTSIQDAALQAARARLQTEDAGEIKSAKEAQEIGTRSVSAQRVAAKFQEMTGLVVTEDQVRNRLRRLDRASAASDAQSGRPVGEAAFEDIEVPKDTYVGFRIAFWDVETTDLKAMMGRILCWAIADNWGNTTSATIYDFPQDSIIDDRGVCIALRDELEKYDINIGWNNRMFDGPMLNARLMRWNERPLRSDLMVIDPMWRARPGAYGIRIGSSKLVNVDKFFNRNSDDTHKSEIEWDTWALAQAGDKEAMQYLVDHCERDVLVTRSVFSHLKPLIKNIHR